MAEHDPLVDPHVVTWSTVLVESFHRVTGDALAAVPAGLDPSSTARALWEAETVVLSHGTQDDPILNYANRAALRRWACRWDEFVGTPSRTTAAPADRAERATAFERLRELGWTDGYRGVRVDRHGHYFEIDDAVLWEIRDDDGRRLGDGATFSISRDLPGDGAY